MRVKDDDDGARLDRWLKKHYPHIPFGQMQKIIRTGQIRIDGKRAKGDARLAAGSELRLPPMLMNAEVSEKAADAKDHAFIKNLVVYEDDDIVVINKPAGLAVQGGSGITRHVDGMLDGLAGASGVRPRLVHRLDKDTSGLLLLARSAKAARNLADSFAGRDIEKIYLAICAPGPVADMGRIDAPLAKGMAGPDLEKMMADHDAGKAAVTDYRVLARGEQAALVEFTPLTGRTHQIRVHAAHIGAPLWGDIKYGGTGKGRFYLHARKLTLIHPKTGKDITLEAPVSPDFRSKCQALFIPFK